jgi:superfamily II RNA helicase
MVILCYDEYKGEELEEFNKYSFPLSDFQKHAIDNIKKGNNVLITAHTGSGKSLPGYFAIDWFVKKGKKIIYTTPIKALSNQKFHELSKEYTDISFGILTGDVRYGGCNKTIICTTEVLLNKLRNKDDVVPNIIPLDIEKEVGCVIFDEVHYINDKERGKVWEETILLLPKNIQMVMLSATLDTPEIFANWIEHNSERSVCLIPTSKRVVPLTHYLFTTSNNGAVKLIKDEQIAKETKKNLNTLIQIQSSDGKFNESGFYDVKRVLGVLEKHKTGRIQQTFVINRCVEYLQQNEMLPAIIFVFSKKKIELFAEKMNIVVLEDDSKVRYLVRNECEQIIKNKFPNYREYIELPEFEFLMTLFEKGVGIHHAGLLPVFRELVEILFEKGYIKVLFATETLAVGINFSVKTVVFTSIEKHDGTELRLLYPHEYNQISGRAGRRGRDTVGNVIHLPNLYKNFNIQDLKPMLQGKPQRLASHFKLSVQSVLLEKENLSEKSMICYEINKELEGIMIQMNVIEQKMAEIRPPSDQLLEYQELENQMKNTRNKNKQKEIRYKMGLIKLQKGARFDAEIQNQQQILHFKADLVDLKRQYDETRNYNTRVYENMRLMLHDFINVPKKGQLTQFFKEVPCLPFVEFVYEGLFNDLTTIQIIQVISCFTQIKNSEQQPPKFLKFVEDKVNYWKDRETQYNLDTGTNYDVHFDLVEPIELWITTCHDNITCNQFLTVLEKEKEIYCGDFVKAVMKINNTVDELKNCCEYMNDLRLLEKLNPIAGMILKHVVNNQSLYV